MPSDLRLGIIGAGEHSTRRVFPVISRLPDVRLAAVCDLDEQKARRNAHRFGAEASFPSHQAMFKHARLDGVIICVEPRVHSRLAIEAMHAGLAVYTEKPPAMTAEDAYQMRQVSIETGRPCMVGFRKRFTPAYERARSIMLSPSFGTPILLSIWRSAGPFAGVSDQPTTWFLLDMGIHVIDLSRFLFGEATQVSAWARDAATYVVHLHFANGALGSLALTAGQSWQQCSERVEITGDRQEFVRIDDSIELMHFSRDGLANYYKANFSASGGDSLIEGGFVAELTEFVNAIREQRAPRSNITDAFQSMLLYEAIRDSAANRVPVTPRQALAVSVSSGSNKEMAR